MAQFSVNANRLDPGEIPLLDELRNKIPQRGIHVRRVPFLLK